MGIANQDKNSIVYTLITGATGGLGQAFCNQLVSSKNLILSGTSTEKLEKLKDRLLEKFPSANIEVFACDLSNEEDRKNLLNFIFKNNFKIEMLINNAGYITEGSIEHADTETLLKCIRVNCEGTIHITKGIIDNRDIEKTLRIINIASMAGNYPMPYMAIYAATKSLIINFMTALRAEYKKKNIKVLNVEPGAIATSEDMKQAIKAQGLKGKLSSVSPDKIAKNSIKKSLKNKKRYIPGFFNKLTIFASNLLPTTIKIKYISNMWRKSQAKRNIK